LSVLMKVSKQRNPLLATLLIHFLIVVLATFTETLVSAN